jgi:hypothetical protein
VSLGCDVAVELRKEQRQGKWKARPPSLPASHLPPQSSKHEVQQQVAHAFQGSFGKPEFNNFHFNNRCVSNVAIALTPIPSRTPQHPMRSLCTSSMCTSWHCALSLLLSLAPFPCRSMMCAVFVRHMWVCRESVLLGSRTP